MNPRTVHETHRYEWYVTTYFRSREVTGVIVLKLALNNRTKQNSTLGISLDQSLLLLART